MREGEQEGSAEQVLSSGPLFSQTLTAVRPEGAKVHIQRVRDGLEIHTRQLISAVGRPGGLPGVGVGVGKLFLIEADVDAAPGPGGALRSQRAAGAGSADEGDPPRSGRAFQRTPMSVLTQGQSSSSLPAGGQPTGRDRDQCAETVNDVIGLHRRR